MTDAEILSFAASMSYAHVDIDPTCCIRYGKERWYQRVPMLTLEQRKTLITRINRMKSMLAKEGITV